MTSVSSNEGKIAVHRQDLEPANPKDSRSLWGKFIDGLRQTIGLKPLHLAERWAVAKVQKEEVDVQAQLLAAKAQYELVMAQVYKMELEAEATYAKSMAETEQIRTSSQLSKRLVAKLLDARNQSPEDALKYLEDTMTRIRMAGGTVEVEHPNDSNDDS